jgi:phenylalanyl-tRNA synthetase beta chain
MRVPLSWLAEYVDLTLPPVELAQRLTMAGVETTYEPGASAGWDHVLVGHVLGIEPHPNADRLRLATVDTGGESETVVCGATNLEVGQRIAFAQIGANLLNGHTGEPMELVAAKIRGVVSKGMICSNRELGLPEEDEGILVLHQDAPIGTPLAEYMPSEVLDIEITANRGDCLSLLGIAHEVAAFTGQTVREPSSIYTQGERPVDQSVTVRIEDPDLCYRYTAAVVRGVKIGPSPRWLQQRLEQAGQRSVNNVVDVTNFVMLEYGQPLHAFDLATITNSTIVVRPATDGERFTTLDGQEHVLRPPMLLIADSEKAIGIAGVMGGRNSEMTNATTDLLLESATFNPINTRRTANALKNRTEASLRFEKGLNPELAITALRRATALVIETAGGVADAGISDTADAEIEPIKLLFTQTHMKRVLGTDFPQMEVVRVLSALGFEVNAIDEDQLVVSPPYWRTDIAIEEDVIEEVARTIGYDAIPESALSGQIPVAINQYDREIREETRDLLTQAGLQETISYSLVSKSLLEQVGVIGEGYPEPLRTFNPMSREQEFMRTSLRGVILRSAAAGLRIPPGYAALFEIGRIFIPKDGDLPDEIEHAVAVLAGSNGDSLWDRRATRSGFYEAKSVVEFVLGRLGIKATFERGNDPILHPGRTARVLANGIDIGVVGELHPRIITSFDFPVETVALLDLDLRKLTQQTRWLRHRFNAFSRYPSAERDLALLVDTQVPADRLRLVIESNELVVHVELFDVFEGEGVPPGKKSLAYRLTLQSQVGNLAAEQINDAVADIVVHLESDTGATLRT